MAVAAERFFIRPQSEAMGAVPPVRPQASHAEAVRPAETAPLAILERINELMSSPDTRFPDPGRLTNLPGVNGTPTLSTGIYIREAVVTPLGEALDQFMNPDGSPVRKDNHLLIVTGDQLPEGMRVLDPKLKSSKRTEYTVAITGYMVNTEEGPVLVAGRWRVRKGKHQQPEALGKTTEYFFIDRRILDDSQQVGVKRIYPIEEGVSDFVPFTQNQILNPEYSPPRTPNEAAYLRMLEMAKQERKEALKHAVNELFLTFGAVAKHVFISWLLRRRAEAEEGNRQHQRYESQNRDPGRAPGTEGQPGEVIDGTWREVFTERPADRSRPRPAPPVIRLGPPTQAPSVA